MKKILVFSLIFLMSISMSSCGNSEQKKAKEAVEAVLDNIISGEKTNSDEELVSNKLVNKESQTDVVDAILSKVSYEINEVKIEGEAGKVMLRVKSPDMYAIMSECSEKSTSIAELENMIEEKTSSNYMEKEYLVEVEVLKKDGEWIIEKNEELMNALYGGLVEAARKILENYINGLAGGK